jgi:hypothetical protein
MAALSLVLAAIFAWGMIAARAAAISTPIFFVAIGLLMAEGLKLVDLTPDPGSTKIIAEVTLVWVLFCGRQPRTLLGAAGRPGALCPITGDRSATNNRTRDGGRRWSTRRELLVGVASGCRPRPDRRSTWFGGHVGSAGSLSSAANTQR